MVLVIIPALLWAGHIPLGLLVKYT